MLIAGHQSLLEKGVILNHDISTGNIMLNKEETHGFLIYLDGAVPVDCPEVCGAPTRTGIKVFMASRALRGYWAYSFVFDLESVLCVLFLDQHLLYRAHGTKWT
jgi:hypothetical protein